MLLLQMFPFVFVDILLVVVFLGVVLFVDAVVRFAVVDFYTSGVPVLVVVIDVFDFSMDIVDVVDCLFTFYYRCCCH